MINARSEIIATTSAFRKAFTDRRLPGPCGRVLRVAEAGFGQATVLHPLSRWRAVRIRRTVGAVAGCRIAYDHYASRE
jgi:hypothetical protein